MIIQTLQKLFRDHPLFESRLLENSDGFLLPARLKGTQMEYVAIRDGERLLVVFNLVLDAHRFSETSTIKSAVRSKLPSPYSHDAYHSLIRAIELEASLIDAAELFDALVEVATFSKMQGLVPLAEDTPWIAKLRKYNQANGAQELEAATNELLETINSANVDLVMSAVRELDPWRDQDPENPLGTRLILLTDLVQRYLIDIVQSNTHLKRLREDYAELAGNWQAEIDEIDHLLSLVVKQSNGTTTSDLT